MFATLYTQVGAALVVIVVLFAFLKGGEPERIGAGAYALGMLASVVIQSGRLLEGPQWGIFAVDIVVLCVYAGLAWKSARVWPIWASALQALVVVSHVMKLIDLRGSANAFAAVINIGGLGILIALAVGTFWAWQERRASELANMR